MQSCAPCQKRIAAWAETDRILREGITPIDDPPVRDAIRARLAQAGQPSASPARVSKVLLFVVIAAIVLLPLL